MLFWKYHDAILQKNIIIIFVQPRVKYQCHVDKLEITILRGKSSDLLLKNI